MLPVVSSPCLSVRVPWIFDFVPLHSASVSNPSSSSPPHQHSGLVFLGQSQRSVCFPSAPSFVLFSFELLVLTMLTEKFFIVILGPTVVTFRCDELCFVFDSVALFFSAIGTLLRLMICIYNYFYLQYYYLQNSILRINFLIINKIIKNNVSIFF